MGVPLLPGHFDWFSVWHITQERSLRGNPRSFRERDVLFPLVAKLDNINQSHGNHHTDRDLLRTQVSPKESRAGR